MRRDKHICNTAWTLSVLAGILALGCQGKPKPPYPDGYFKGSVQREEALTLQFTEQGLSRWKPTKTNDQIPWTRLQSPQTDITGDWVVSRSMNGSALRIRRLEANRYTVEFSTGGCLSHWKLKRTGEYTQGVLHLNRPVQEYLPLTYQKLYAVRVAGRDYLVADTAVGDFEKGLSKRTLRPTDEVTISFFAYRRNPHSTA